MAATVGSMILALAQAIAARLMSQQAQNPSPFPVSFTAQCKLAPQVDLANVPPFSQPLVYVIPMNDSEDRKGLNENSFEGDFAVVVIILARTGDWSVREANAAVLLNLRQAIVDVLKPQSAIVAAGVVNGTALLNEKEGSGLYDWQRLVTEGAFDSRMLLKFHVAPV